MEGEGVANYGRSSDDEQREQERGAETNEKEENWAWAKGAQTKKPKKDTMCIFFVE